MLGVSAAQADSSNRSHIGHVMILMTSLTQQGFCFREQNRKNFRLCTPGLNFSHLLSDDFSGRPFQLRIHNTCVKDLLRKYICNLPQFLCKLYIGKLQHIDLLQLHEAVALHDPSGGVVDLRAQQVEETKKIIRMCNTDAVPHQHINIEHRPSRNCSVEYCGEEVVKNE